MLGKARPASDQTRSDISRLLDPSYTTSYYTTQQQTTYGAYVDAQGNMHDPDYRHFPLIQHASQYSSSRRTTGHTRPHWELVDEEAGLLDADEDLPEEDPFHAHTYNTNSPKRNSYGTYKSASPSPRHYPASHRSSSPSGGMRIYPRTTTSAGFGGAVLSSPSEVSAWSASSCSESSSPSSTCSSVLRSPSAYEAASEKSRCRISASLKRKRRRSAATAASEKEMMREREFDDENDFLYRQEWPVAEEEEEEEELAQEAEDEAREERVVETGDDVPTCNEVLRRRWQALSLSIRFGMFRAERRIKRRVQSLI
ncbi:hypothetical protein DFP72DRAFT_479544 [Ephemerocybe angulata]|uniref:Uncharacterized protein n=1 Tax=Ephemerocybe angulata TaxID=980116 RepID=A0A8H6IGX4_9AGAR|nr:hypothetical protein DFP72DRAFT_479544 [Tulosesus angulatus]